MDQAWRREKRSRYQGAFHNGARFVMDVQANGFTSGAHRANILDVLPWIITSYKVATKMQLTSEKVAQLFTVSESQWTAINKRVGHTVYTKGIAGVITEMLPVFPQLEVVCDLWMSTTFPGLIAHSAALVTYADQSTQQFTDLQNALAALGTNTDPLPASLQLQALTALQNLQQSSNTLGAEFNELSQQVSNFASINNQIDVEILHYQSQFGPWWAPIGAKLSEIDAATGQVQGVWSAITSDLQNALTLVSPAEITNSFLLGLDISVALSAWASIKTEATAFASMANGQTQYWTNWQ
jgi:hypothetical protein